MHPCIERWLHGLCSPLYTLRRILRRVAKRPDDGKRRAHPDDETAARRAKSENDMTEHNELDANPKDDVGIPEDAPNTAAHSEKEPVSDEDLEATLQSMQGELTNLTDMLASEDSGEQGASAPAEPPVASAADADDPAPEAEAEAEVEPEGTLSGALEVTATESDEAAELNASVASAENSEPAAEVEAQVAPEAVRQIDDPPQPVRPDTADVPAVVEEQSLKEQPAGAEAFEPARTTAPATGFATARRRALEETRIPQPEPRQSRAAHRSPASDSPTGPVESAILHFASFLEGEVNVLWGDARAALSDILTYRNRMAQATERIEILEREILNMRDEIAFSRRESRNLQAQMQNIRDDAARARQRADTAATDAQSAADRAVSASREIETAASLHRDR